MTQRLRGSGSRQCSPDGLHGNWSTEHSCFPKPLTVYTMPDKNLDTSIPVAYCLAFLANLLTRKDQVFSGIWTEVIKTLWHIIPRAFFSQGYWHSIHSKVKASSPRLRFPANPILSNICTQTYWWPPQGHCPIPPPSFHLVAWGSSLLHRLALGHGRKLLWVVSLDSSLWQSPPCMELSNKERSIYLTPIIIQKHPAPPSPWCLSSHSLCPCKQLSSSLHPISAREDTSAMNPATSLPWPYVLETFHTFFFPISKPDWSHQERPAPFFASRQFKDGWQQADRCLAGQNSAGWCSPSCNSSVDKSKILSSGIANSLQLYHQRHNLPEHISSLKASFIFRQKPFIFIQKTGPAED